MSTGSTAASGVVTFVRRVIATLGARVLISMVTLSAGVIVARALGSAALGVISSLNVMALLAITVGNFGLPSSITFLVARDPSSARSVLKAAVIFGVCIGSVMAAVVCSVIWIWPGLMGSTSSDLVIITCVALPFQMISYLCLAVHLGLEKIRSYNLLDVLLQATALAGALIVAVILARGVRELVIFNTAGNIVVCVVILFATFAATQKEKERPVLRKLLHYGSRFFVALVAGMIILRGDLLIVNYFRSPREAAVYAVATQASVFLQMLPNVISTVLFPRTAGEQDESGEKTCRVTRHSVVLLLLLCVAAVPCSFLLPLLYGPEFRDLPFLFMILLPGVFLLGLQAIEVQHFSGLGLPRRIPVIWIAALVFTITLDLILVPNFGAFAAAGVSTAAYTLVFVFVSSFFLERTGRSFRETFVIRGDELRALVILGKTADQPG
jgi:O-antigen/teichoic acid export membrane protein